MKPIRDMFDADKSQAIVREQFERAVNRLSESRLPGIMDRISALRIGVDIDAKFGFGQEGGYVPPYVALVEDDYVFDGEIGITVRRKLQLTAPIHTDAFELGLVEFGTMEDSKGNEAPYENSKLPTILPDDPDHALLVFKQKFEEFHRIPPEKKAEFDALFL